MPPLVQTRFDAFVRFFLCQLESDPTLDLSEVLVIVDPLDATRVSDEAASQQEVNAVRAAGGLSGVAIFLGSAAVAAVLSWSRYLPVSRLRLGVRHAMPLSGCVVVVSCRAMSRQVSYSVMFRRYLWVDFASFTFVFGSRALLGRFAGGRPERGSLACTNECLRCAHACPSPSCALNLCRLALLACCGRSKVVSLPRPSLIFPWVLVGVLSVLMVQDDAADVGGTRCTYSRVLRLGWQRGCRASR